MMALSVVTQQASLRSSAPTWPSHEDALEPEALMPCIWQVRLDPKKDGAADFTIHVCGVSLLGLPEQEQSSLVLVQYQYSGRFSTLLLLTHPCQK